MLCTLAFGALNTTGLCLESDGNTSFLLHMNNDLVDFSAQAKTPTLSSGVFFEPGVVGSAAYFSTSNQLMFSSGTSISGTNGTLEFFIKPRWNGNDGQSHSILMFGGAGGLLFQKDGGNYLRCIVNRYGASGGNPEAGVGVNISDWVSNQWHYVAFTWSDSSLHLYVDGVRQATSHFDYTLPAIGSATFQIGADNSIDAADATIDELRISFTARSDDEIRSAFIADVNLTGLAIVPTNKTLLPTWGFSPSLVLTSSLGVGAFPATWATWTSADTNIADIDSDGVIVGKDAGVTTLTAMLEGKSASLTLNVVPPIRLPTYDAIDTALSIPATNAIYDMPVVIINYIPTPDGTNVDDSIYPQSTIEDFKATMNLRNRWTKFMLEEGSKYHGYQNANAHPSLGYRVVQVISVYEPMPPGRDSWEEGLKFPDYYRMMERFNIGAAVSNLNVKEVWIWGYHDAGIAPLESNMSSPTTGDISNSDRVEDLPIYDRTYVVYHFNAALDQGYTHDHGHQLEAILGYVNQRQDGNDDLFWKKFCGRNLDGSWQQGRCGDNHHPPNAEDDYDYSNPLWVSSDCMDWTPDKVGQLSLVNSNTWGSIPYPWPNGSIAREPIESQFYIFWRQNMPGWQNGIRYGTNVMANWWEFTGDWDNAIRANRGLYRIPQVSFVPGSLTVTNGTFRAALAGDAGFDYVLEATTNFTSWASIGILSNFAGAAQIADPQSAISKFYRVRATSN